MSYEADKVCESEFCVVCGQELYEWEYTAGDTNLTCEQCEKEIDWEEEVFNEEFETTIQVKTLTIKYDFSSLVIQWADVVYQ